MEGLAQTSTGDSSAADKPKGDPQVKTLSMDDNLYSVPPGTFELLAQCVNTLCEFPEIELAEVANRDGYAPGCAATVYSSKNEHRIEIDGSTGAVSLNMTPLDASVEVNAAPLQPR
jgi:hypothetical protein